MYHQRKQLRILLVVAIVMCPAVAPSKADEPAPADKPTAGSMRGKAPREVRDDNGLKMKLVWCPPGFLTMEQVARIEQPRYFEPGDVRNKSVFVEETLPVKVFITRGYWLGKYEVTQAEWMQVMARAQWNGQQQAKEGDDFPASFISWFDAMDYCRKLTKLERKAGRLPEGWEYTLPTETQWERACRARTDTKFSFGDDAPMLTKYAWFHDNCGGVGEAYAHRVGQKEPNPWGFYDMHGNMSEWCLDSYAEKLPGGRDPDVANWSSYQVIRGGCWDDGASRCRSAFRARNIPNARFGAYGFRVALTSVQPVKPWAGTRGDTSGQN